MYTKLFFQLLFSVFGLCLHAQNYQAWKVLKGHQGAITCLQLRQEDNLLISGDELGGIRIWDLSGDAPRLVGELSDHNGAITALEFNDEGNFLVSASYDGKCILWNAENWRVMRLMENPAIPAYRNVNGNEPTFAIFGPQSDCILFGGYNMAISKAPFGSQQLEKVFSNSGGGITCGVLSPSKQYLVFGLLGRILFYDLQRHMIGFSLEKSSSFNDFVCELAFVPRSQLLASWNYNGEIQFWNIQERELAFSIKATDRKGSSNLRFSNDGVYMISGNSGNQAKLWSTSDQQLIQVLDAHEKEVTSFAFSADSRWIATGSRDNNIWIWKRDQPLVDNSVPTSTIASTDSADELTAEEGNGNGEFVYEDRPIDVQETIILDQNSFKISVFDNRQIDGDIISIRYGNKWILKEYTLQRDKKIFWLPFQKEEEYLIVYAHNLGSRPPNTIAIEIDGGSFHRQFSLKADMGSSAALKFVKTKY